MTAADPNLSGINLSRPSDSGINLQGAGAFDLGHHDSIELAPLSDEEIKTHQSKTAKSGKPAPAAKPGKAATGKAGPAKAKPSLAATPPPAVKKGEKDIFDDTDFEVDVPIVRGRLFRRQDRAARGGQRFRSGRQRQRVGSLRDR